MLLWKLLGSEGREEEGNPWGVQLTAVWDSRRGNVAGTVLGMPSIISRYPEEILLYWIYIFFVFVSAGSVLYILPCGGAFGFWKSFF